MFTNCISLLCIFELVVGCWLLCAVCCLSVGVSQFSLWYLISAHIHVRAYFYTNSHPLLLFWPVSAHDFFSRTWPQQSCIALASFLVFSFLSMVLKIYVPNWGSLSLSWCTPSSHSPQIHDDIDSRTHGLCIWYILYAAQYKLPTDGHKGSLESILYPHLLSLTRSPRQQQKTNIKRAKQTKWYHYAFCKRALWSISVNMFLNLADQQLQHRWQGKEKSLLVLFSYHLPSLHRIVAVLSTQSEQPLLR